MKVREDTYYRAAYCGLCRSLGRCTGQCSRLTLSYDLAFLALLRLALQGERLEIKPRRCVLHPLKKRPMAEAHRELDFSACASAIILYRKVMDDRADEKGRKKFCARIATPYVKSLRRKINRRGYGDLGAEIETILDELDKLEASRPPSVDQPAALFGKAMAHLLSFDLEGSRARIARELGTHLGRWIYLVDAIDDFESDLKAGRYNPFACLWQDGDMTPSRREYLENVLAAELEAMENALDLAESSEGDKDLWGVIRNILYLGMPARAHSILFPNDGAVEEKSK